MREIIFLNEELLDEGLRSRLKTRKAIKGVTRKIGGKTYSNVDGDKDFYKALGGTVAGAAFGGSVGMGLAQTDPEISAIPAVAYTLLGAGTGAANALDHRSKAHTAAKEHVNNHPAVVAAREKAKTTKNPKDMTKYLDSIKALEKDDKVLDAVHNDYIDRRYAAKVKRAEKKSEKADKNVEKVKVLRDLNKRPVSED